MNFYLLTAYFFLVLINSSFQNHLLARARNSHFPGELNDNQLEFLATKLSNISHIERVLDNLLIPRVVGTPGHKKVSQYIIKELEGLGWNIELDEFDDETPFGKLRFRNIIATLNPKADRFLTLACHYDSKYFKNHDFIGATDSGVPCAMMLNLAFVLKAELDKIKSNADLSLKLVFFDGEEAFKQWGPKDSIYGARHLAEKWHGNSKLTSFNEMATDISRIDVLVLLDLIGTRNPKFYSFFQQTQKWYDRLPDAESRLADLNLLDAYNPKQIYFNRQATYSFIEDDHIPFLQRRVPVLHLIPIPFPEVWHTEGDNRDIVDISTVENINKVLRIFVAEYLHLSSSDEEDRKISKLEL